MSFRFRVYLNIRFSGHMTPTESASWSFRPIAKAKCVPLRGTSGVRLDAYRFAAAFQSRLPNQLTKLDCLSYAPPKRSAAEPGPTSSPSERIGPSHLFCGPNTTLGLLAFWWIGTRQQQGRACLTITQLPQLTVLDPRNLSEDQLVEAAAIFERFMEREFLPANEAYRDDVRQDLDRAVLVDLLRLPDGVMESLAILRDQWCAEPSVHGGKKTRIDTAP